MSEKVITEGFEERQVYSNPEPTTPKPQPNSNQPKPDEPIPDQEEE